MELKQHLQMKLTQQLVMTPQLQMAIKLLQLSRIELEQVVREQLEENPLLEEAKSSLEETLIEEQSDGVLGEDIIIEQVLPSPETSEPTAPKPLSWESFIKDRKTYSVGPSVKLTNEEVPSPEAVLSRKISLQDHLLWQVRLSNLKEEDIKICEEIIGNINEDGYLVDVSVEELADKFYTSVDRVENLLHKIQQMDPVGVGARTPQECLIIQARVYYPEKEIVHKILESHLKNLERKNYGEIIKSLKCTMEDMVEAVNIITALEPKPGRFFNSEEPEYIVPDVYVYKIGDEYITVLNEDGLPKLKINKYYENIFVDKVDCETKKFILEKFRSAVSIIKSIHQRQNTIRKVTESIVRFQSEFFDKGINYLKPLILKDVADDIGMHESTVSRVTTNKYVHTPHGILELKYFFNSRISGTTGDDLASESIKQKIRHLIEHEDKKSPYSDQKIADILRGEKIDIARRTVAKYREQMKIPPSQKRKKII